jgi:glycosyltransferase involved in cell wall biosynthesis
MPVVSVIIPFYNRLPWTAEAVQSVLDQTFKDFEILLIDDGSESDSRKQIRTDDPRIKYNRQEHKGSAAARNLGITLARGRYVAFLDSDDLFLATKLEEQIAVMDSDPTIVFSHTSYIQIDDKGVSRREVHSGTFTGTVYPRILTYCPIATPTVMVKTNVLKKLSFEEKITVGEDIILWSKIAQKWKILGIHKALSKVRVNMNSTINNYGIQIQFVQNLIDYAINTDKELKFFEKRRINSTMHSFRSSSYFHQRLYCKAIRSALLAFLTCPVNPDLYLPKIKKIIREKIWDRS